MEEQTAIGERQLNILKQRLWADECLTLIMMAPTCVGKTHLSTTLGISRHRAWIQVSLISMDSLIYILKSRVYVSKSRIKNKRITQSDHIIINDVIYMAYEPQDAHLFFQFIYKMYDKAAFILTSKKGPEEEEWGKFLVNTTLTIDILDRLLHRSEILSFSEVLDSIRMKYRKELFNNQKVEF